jgi:hypothetical protein
LGGKWPRGLRSIHPSAGTEEHMDKGIYVGYWVSMDIMFQVQVAPIQLGYGSNSIFMCRCGCGCRQVEMTSRTAYRTA